MDNNFSVDTICKGKSLVELFLITRKRNSGLNQYPLSLPLQQLVHQDQFPLVVHYVMQ